MTSDKSWSGSARRVGDLERPDHYLLRPDDVCYFFGDYTSNESFSYSETNQLIRNLKKPPSVRGTAQWPHKERAIERAARAIRSSLQEDALDSMTVVPIPPSRPKSSPDHDDRMLQVVRRIDPRCDVRELLLSTADREARHVSGARRDPDALKASLELDRSLCRKEVRRVLLVDDVLTTGCSFTVCKDMIRDYFGDVTVVGMFVARRVLPKPDFESMFGDVRLP